METKSQLSTQPIINKQNYKISRRIKPVLMELREEKCRSKTDMHMCWAFCNQSALRINQKGEHVCEYDKKTIKGLCMLPHMHVTQPKSFLGQRNGMFFSDHSSHEQQWKVASVDLSGCNACWCPWIQHVSHWL